MHTDGSHYWWVWRHCQAVRRCNARVLDRQRKQPTLVRTRLPTSARQGVYFSSILQWYICWATQATCPPYRCWRAEANVPHISSSCCNAGSSIPARMTHKHTKHTVT